MEKIQNDQLFIMMCRIFNQLRDNNIKVAMFDVIDKYVKRYHREVAMNDDLIGDIYRSNGLLK